MYRIHYRFVYIIRIIKGWFLQNKFSLTPVLSCDELGKYSKFFRKEQDT